MKQKETAGLEPAPHQTSPRSPAHVRAGPARLPPPGRCPRGRRRSGERRVQPSAGGDGPVPRHAGESRGRHGAGALLQHGDRRIARPGPDARRATDPRDALSADRRERARAECTAPRGAHGSLRSRPRPRPAVRSARQGRGGRVELGGDWHGRRLEAESGRGEGGPAHRSRCQPRADRRDCRDHGAHGPEARRLVGARERRGRHRVEGRVRRREGREAEARQAESRGGAWRRIPGPAGGRLRARFRRPARAGPGGRRHEPVRSTRGPADAHGRERRSANQGSRLAPRGRRRRARARTRRRAQDRPACGRPRGAARSRAVRDRHGRQAGGRRCRCAEVFGRRARGRHGKGASRRRRLGRGNGFRPGSRVGSRPAEHHGRCVRCRLLRRGGRRASVGPRRRRGCARGGDASRVRSNCSSWPA